MTACNHQRVLAGGGHPRDDDHSSLSANNPPRYWTAATASSQVYQAFSATLVVCLRLSCPEPGGRASREIIAEAVDEAGAEAGGGV